MRRKFHPITTNGTCALWGTPKKFHMVLGHNSTHTRAQNFSITAPGRKFRHLQAKKSFEALGPTWRGALAYLRLFWPSLSIHFFLFHTSCSCVSLSDLHSNSCIFLISYWHDSKAVSSHTAKTLHTRNCLSEKWTFSFTPQLFAVQSKHVVFTDKDTLFLKSNDIPSNRNP